MTAYAAVIDSCKHPAVDESGHCTVCGKLIITEWSNNENTN